ncbi:unnamed protein product [Clavelina lepadiformis]|uniref:Uncharacterized protein n=1 Tax=Clavelina lepadiformis TaxID=159417 RepID=A0ABP0FZI7_CLALP
MKFRKHCSGSLNALLIVLFLFFLMANAQNESGFRRRRVYSSNVVTQNRKNVMRNLLSRHRVTHTAGIRVSTERLYGPNICGARCCPGWTTSKGGFCTTAICKPSCQNGGTCLKPNKCKCPLPYRGRTCGSRKYKSVRTMMRERMNKNRPSQRATVLDTFKGRNNSPTTGFQPTNALRANSPSCSDITCLNGGACVGASCMCPSGFAGGRCQYRNVPRVISASTLERSLKICKALCVNGKCQPFRGNHARCICDQGYQGTFCKTKISSSLPARIRTSSPRRPIPTFRPSLRSRRRKIRRRRKFPSDSPYSNFGKCYRRYGNGTCSLAYVRPLPAHICCRDIGQAWGENCTPCVIIKAKISRKIATTVRCGKGYNLVRGKCRDVNECQSGKEKCKDGKCVNIRGSYWCKCYPGYHLGPTRKSCLPKAVKQTHLNRCCIAINKSGKCTAPITVRGTKSTCCCSLGVAWGVNDELCPLDGTDDRRLLCPYGSGYSKVPSSSEGMMRMVHHIQSNVKLHSNQRPSTTAVAETTSSARTFIIYNTTRSTNMKHTTSTFTIGYMETQPFISKREEIAETQRSEATTEAYSSSSESKRSFTDQSTVPLHSETDLSIVTEPPNKISTTKYFTTTVKDLGTDTVEVTGVKERVGKQQKATLESDDQNHGEPITKYAKVSTITVKTDAPETTTLEKTESGHSITSSRYFTPLAIVTAPHSSSQQIVEEQTKHDALIELKNIQENSTSSQFVSNSPEVVTGRIISPNTAKLLGHVNDTDDTQLKFNRQLMKTTSTAFASVDPTTLQLTTTTKPPTTPIVVTSESPPATQPSLERSTLLLTEATAKKISMTSYAVTERPTELSPPKTTSIAKYLFHRIASTFTPTEGQSTTRREHLPTKGHAGQVATTVSSFTTTSPSSANVFLKILNMAVPRTSNEKKGLDHDKLLKSGNDNEVRDACHPSRCLNNGTCVLSSIARKGFFCSCPSGFRGSLCQFTYLLHMCIFQPCLHGGTCKDHANGFRCACQEGYRGKRCHRDVDECNDLANCVGGSCINVPGSFYCACPTGYLRSPDRSACADVDECERSPCPRGMRCQNSPGSYHCECEGLQEQFDPVTQRCLSPNLPTTTITSVLLEPIGEERSTCYTDHQTCGHVLVANVTEQECCCTMGRAWGKCNSCPFVGTPGYQQLCPKGHGLIVKEDSPEILDIDECSLFDQRMICPNGKCENSYGAFQCICNRGFYYNRQAHGCEDFDECMHGDKCVGGTCSNTIGAFRCQCPSGSVLRYGRAKAVCVPIPTERSQGRRWFENGRSSTRRQRVDQCSRGSCQHGICVSTKTGNVCRCRRGYKFDPSTRTCVDINECVEQNRLYFLCIRGRCINTDGSFLCKCNPGYKLTRNAQGVGLCLRDVITDNDYLNDRPI